MVAEILDQPLKSGSRIDRALAVYQLCRVSQHAASIPPHLTAFHGEAGMMYPRYRPEGTLFVAGGIIILLQVLHQPALPLELGFKRPGGPFLPPGAGVWSYARQLQRHRASIRVRGYL